MLTGRPESIVNPSIPITEVTVHPDGAIVTRRGALPIQNGQLTVRGLPLTLDESSVRVSAEGGVLRELRLGLDLESAGRPAATEAWRALRDAAQAVERIDAERKLVLAQRQSLSELLPMGPDAFDEGPAAPGLAQLAAWARLHDPLRGWAEALDARLRELDEASRLAHERRQVCAYALGNESSDAWWKRWLPTRVAALGIDGEGEVALTLSYRVEGALWAPAYTLHADREIQRGRLAIRALVAQVTGEDWTGVRLALSTAPCTRSVDLPELHALRLGTRQPPRARAWRELPPGLDDLFPNDDLTLTRPQLVEAALPELNELPGAKAAEPVTQVEITAETAPQPARPEPSKKRRKAAAREEVMLDDVADDEGGATQFFAMPSAPPQNLPMAAPAGPPPAMMAEAAAPMRSRGALGGAAPKPAPPPPPPAELQTDALDYPRLRLRGYSDPRGVRGRLHGVSLADEARECGLPPAGSARLNEVFSAMLARIRGLSGRSLPPRHVLAGPIAGIDARYDAEGSVDIPSDGQFHNLTVRGEPAELKVIWRSVPREDPRVFRLVIVNVESRLALLPGPVDVYVDGAFTLTVDWKGAPRGAQFRVGLGVEDRLKLARNVRYWEETAGLLRGSRRLHTEITVDIASSLGRDVSVELLERLPQPGEDAIKVELARAEPEARVYEGEPGGPTLKGGRAQTARVPAAGVCKAVLHYSVTLDNTLELQGGDRRG